LRGFFYAPETDYLSRKLTLMRHATIAAELDGHYIGRSDVPLNDNNNHPTIRKTRHHENTG